MLRKRAIEYQWALQEGSTRSNLERLRMNFEITEMFNRFSLISETLDHLSTDHIPIAMIILEPMGKVIESPAEEMIKIIWEDLFREIPIIDY